MFPKGDTQFSSLQATLSILIQHCISNKHLFIYLQSNRKYAYLVFSFRFYFHYFTISTTYSLKTRIYFCYLVTEPFNHVGNLTQIVTTNSHNKRDKNKKKKKLKCPKMNYLHWIRTFKCNQQRDILLQIKNYLFSNSNYNLVFQNLE